MIHLLPSNGLSVAYSASNVGISFYVYMFIVICVLLLGFFLTIILVVDQVSKYSKPIHESKPYPEIMPLLCSEHRITFKVKGCKDHMEVGRLKEFQVGKIHPDPKFNNMFACEVNIWKEAEEVNNFFVIVDYMED